MKLCPLAVESGVVSSSEGTNCDVCLLQTGLFIHFFLSALSDTKES